MPGQGLVAGAAGLATETTAAVEFQFSQASAAASQQVAGGLSDIVALMGRLATNPLIGAGLGARFSDSLARVAKGLANIKKQGLSIEDLLEGIDWTKIGAGLVGFAVSSAFKIAELKQKIEVETMDMQRALAFEPDFKMSEWIDEQIEMLELGGTELEKVYARVIPDILPYLRDIPDLQRMDLGRRITTAAAGIDPSAARDIIDLYRSTALSLEESTEAYEKWGTVARQNDLPFREYYQVVSNIFKATQLYGRSTEDAYEMTELFTEAISKGDISIQDAAQSLQNLNQMQMSPQNWQTRMLWGRLFADMWGDLPEEVRNALDSVYEEAFLELDPIEQADAIARMGEQFGPALKQLTDTFEAQLGYGGGAAVGLLEQVLRVPADTQLSLDRVSGTLETISPEELAIGWKDFRREIEASYPDIKKVTDIWAKFVTSLERFVALAKEGDAAERARMYSGWDQAVRGGRGGARGARGLDINITFDGDPDLASRARVDVQPRPPKP